MTEYQRRVRKIEYEPWLLGWCRWEIVLEMDGWPGQAVMRQTLASGRWRWRGRGAKVSEFVFEVGTVTNPTLEWVET